MRKVLPRYIDKIQLKEINIAKKSYLELTINEDVQVYYNKENILIEDVQDMINKGAYASAINYLNLNGVLLVESSFNDIIDSESDVENFYEDCENLLNECIYETEELGRPFMSLTEECNLLEGVDNFIRNENGKNIVEDFRSNFKNDDLSDAIVIGLNEGAVRLVTNNNEVYDIVVENEKLYNLLNGERNVSVFKRMGIKESHKVGFMNFNEAYKDSEPVAINGLSVENGQVIMKLINKYNQVFKRVINIESSDLTPEQFIEPYTDEIEKIKGMDDFENAVQASKPILDDLDNYATGYKRKSYQGDEKNAYKSVKEYIDDLVPIDAEVYNENTLRLILADKDGKMYSVLYTKKDDSNIDDLELYADDLAIDIYDIVDKVQDYDTAYDKTRDIMLELEYEFIPGRKTKATDWGDYEWSSLESVDESGTECADIAPKTDYFDDKKELLLSNIDEEDICLKGFMRNSSGYYERGNYVLIKENEQYKVINKNKLNGGK